MTANTEPEHTAKAGVGDIRDLRSRWRLSASVQQGDEPGSFEFGFGDALPVAGFLGELVRGRKTDE